jgi:hypothetical protein
MAANVNARSAGGSHPASVRDGDYALTWNCLLDGLEVRFVMTYVF